MTFETAKPVRKHFARKTPAHKYHTWQCVGKLDKVTSSSQEDNPDDNETPKLNVEDVPSPQQYDSTETVKHM